MPDQNSKPIALLIYANTGAALDSPKPETEAIESHFKVIGTLRCQDCSCLQHSHPVLLRQTPEEPIFHELVDFPTSRRYDNGGLVGTATQLHAKVTQIGIGKLSYTDRL